MKLHVCLGPLPIAPPYFDREDDEDVGHESPEYDEEIDLTELLNLPANKEGMN